MQTVYLLKDCYKSYSALKRLYSFPDLSTCIILVDIDQAKILLLDKRVKKFPFIINTLPTNLGLIPKIARVLPLEMFMMLKKFHENKYNCENKYNRENENKYKFKTAHPVNNVKPRKSVDNFYKPRITHKKPLIKTVKDSDGGINIILNK